ncbi:hypothetical protein E2C01_038017 [Portunus trituberculatus]|uniref:Uncharacterized protein n=1 Tax=Portunus trituberculatus TaxID=210409 RepID=A0A5B7FGV2_PORTR|nr:hypothetical protein [Portunus trituberculatus]
MDCGSRLRVTVKKALGSRVCSGYPYSEQLSGGGVALDTRAGEDVMAVVGVAEGGGAGEEGGGLVGEWVGVGPGRRS